MTDVSAMHDALKVANLEYCAMSWNGFNVFTPDKRNLDEVMRMQNEAANADTFRDEIKKLRAEVAHWRAIAAALTTGQRNTPDTAGNKEGR